ncbi:hypothetical protein FNW25_13880 [Flavobacterium franklandianum]|uniref:Uncharacterized protein n=1 Tax=Flavobacterium franklandianum TaxID=2594430 RepID=A0A553CKA8_9FLAO|nr:hypothetical protein [Flavobacterium franklandianum]TRX20921.1 hypothetical protein FNW17_09640 [Flavobacterium franklandianum]TRX23137.1 hypothetical protein FNW25_13880 [Flavobacterium franklandianum]
MNKLFLEAYIESFSNFETAMNGLTKSLEHCTSIGIKSNYAFEETEAFDALIIKLTRNSDVFFQQIVKAYFKLKGEDGLMFIDRLNMLEKMGVIDNVDQLMVLKSFRNQAVHEYSAVAFQELYQEALELAPFFIKTVRQFQLFLVKESILKG